MLLLLLGKYAGKKDGRPEVCIVEVGYEQCKVVGLDGKQGARIAIARGAVHDADDEERASQDVSIKGASTKPVYLCYGQTVRFGSKAVALYDEIPAEHYRSGAVFLAKPPDAVLRGDRRKRSEVLKERSAGLRASSESQGPSSPGSPRRGTCSRSALTTERRTPSLRGSPTSRAGASRRSW